MPEKLHRKLAKQAGKLGPKGERRNAYIYGAMRATGWRPRRGKRK